MKSSTFSFMLLAAAISIFSTSAFSQPNEAPDIRKVMTLFKGIGNRQPALATKYIDATSFINHDPTAPDGVEGLNALIAQLPPEKSSLEVVRAFQDGPFVFTQAQGDLFGRKVFFDIFRFENGKIVEHWDNIADVNPPNQSGHTATDGPTRATHLEDTKKNKAFVTDFYKTIFLQGEFQKIGNFFDGDKFIRHDARGGDGLNALATLMQTQAKQGIVMKVEKINHVLGEGDFVLVTASGSIAGKPVAYYDLFRVEAGKIAEHWDVIQNIPPQSE